jgi:type II secretory pathway pseudopilin PulG
MIGAKKIHLSPGFSVIEMLVVMFLFSTSMVILSQTYLSFIHLSHRTANAALIQQDTRFVLEYITRNVRGTPLAYPAPPEVLDTVSTTLKLAKDGGEIWMITKSDVGDVRCTDVPTVSCLLVSSDNGLTWTPVTSRRVNVETFNIYVRPSVTPFVLQGATYGSNEQPFVTIQMKLSYVAPNDKEVVTQESQTTISSRVYVR